MSRTIRGSKGAGYDFWSRRPHSGNGHGRVVKDMTHRTERAIAKRDTHEETQRSFDMGD
jgi:hypothetical protein